MADSAWVRGPPPVQSAVAQGRFREPWKGADAATVPGTAWFHGKGLGKASRVVQSEGGALSLNPSFAT